MTLLVGGGGDCGIDVVDWIRVRGAWRRFSYFVVAVVVVSRLGGVADWLTRHSRFSWA